MAEKLQRALSGLATLSAGLGVGGWVLSESLYNGEYPSLQRAGFPLSPRECTRAECSGASAGDCGWRKAPEAPTLAFAAHVVLSHAHAPRWCSDAPGCRESDAAGRQGEGDPPLTHEERGGGPPQPPAWPRGVSLGCRGRLACPRRCP